MAGHQVGLSGIYNCCGAFLLHTLFKNPNLLKSVDEAKRQIGLTRMVAETDEAYIKRCDAYQASESHEQYLRRVQTAVEGYINQYKNKKSFFILILNVEEHAVLNELFLDLGFEVIIPMTKNPTGTAIITYVYHLLPRIYEKQVTSVIKKRAA